MPEHTSFFTYLVQKLPLFENLRLFGRTLAGKPVGEHQAESLVGSLFVVLLIILFAIFARRKVVDYDKSVLPEDKLTLRTFFELFVGYFYDMLKDMVGPKKAKRYFPLIGTCAVFIFFSNILGLIPGMVAPTSTWSITAGCGLVVFVAFNYYGLKEQGWAYIKHYAGPVWYMAWLIFPLELFSMLIRPITLSLRLFLNMAADHLILTLIFGLLPILVPVPLMVLGTLVAVVQTLVFSLLSGIYIQLATEEHEHEEGHGEPAHATP